MSYYNSRLFTMLDGASINSSTRTTVNSDPVSGIVEMARGDKSIATIVSRPDQDNYGWRGGTGESFDDVIGNCSTSVFHESRCRHAERSGRLLERFHLVDGHNPEHRYLMSHRYFESFERTLSWLGRRPAL